MSTVLKQNISVSLILLLCIVHAGTLSTITPVPVLTAAPGSTPAPTAVALRGSQAALATSAVRHLSSLPFCSCAAMFNNDGQILPIEAR